MNTLITLLLAAVPLRWTVETTKVQPAQFEVVHGESIALEATLQSGGKPLDLTGETAHIYWQTNGMDQAWWTASATVTSNRLSAVFLPEMDPGASAVTGYIGVPGEIYRAAFQLRFRHGPGATPNEIEPPVRTLDFARVTVANAPWATPDDVADEAEARADADAALSTRITELTGGAVTESDVQRIASGIADEKTNTKVDGKVLVEIPAGAYTFDNGKNGFKAWAWRDDSGWHAHAVNSGNLGQPTINSNPNEPVSFGWEVYFVFNGASGQWNADSGGTSYFENLHPHNIQTTERETIAITSFVGNLNTDESKAAIVATATPQAIGAVPVTRKVNGQPLTSDINIEGMSTNAVELKSGELKTHDNATIITASHVGAYTTSQVDAALAGKASSATVEALGQQMGAIGLHLNAEDAKVVITNYNSVVHMPEASFQVKVDGEWLKVWDEMTRWNWFLGDTFDPFTNQVYSALSTKGEKEWGWFNSATGDASPDGLLQLAQPRIQICSGAAYQHYGTASGGYWVLESNGLVANINGTTNGFFRVSDEEGNAQFEIVKGDNQTVYATAKTVTSEVMGVTHFFTEYTVTNALSHPVAEFTLHLEQDQVNWIAETDPSCPFNVNWTNKGDNTYEIEWWPKGTLPQAFMKCVYEIGGETYIKNSAPVSMEYLILDGVKYRLGTATINGNTVLTLTR